MVILWGVGGLLVVLGAVLVVATLLRRGGAADNQRLSVVAGLVMTGLGVVAMSAAALAGGDDDEDPVVAGSDTTSSTSADGKSDDDGSNDSGNGSDFEDDSGSGDDDSAVSEDLLPPCFDEYLAVEPVVSEDDHYRLDVGVNREVIATMQSADAIALELVDDGELLGVMRIGDQVMPVSDVLHVFDVVDAQCQPVEFTPQDTDDEVADTHQTVVPLTLAGQGYEVTFVQHGIQPELDVVLRRA